MKTLLLLRHAKSSWKQRDVEDHERPLNKRGKQDAPRMGHLLRAQNLVPDAILSSTAVRARATAETVARSSRFSGEIQFKPDLYLAAPGMILSLCREIPDTVNRALIVAHNPGLEELVALFSHRSERFPTAALAHIELSVNSWHELSLEVPAELANLWLPRELREG